MASAVFSSSTPVFLKTVIEYDHNQNPIIKGMMRWSDTSLIPHYIFSLEELKYRENNADEAGENRQAYTTAIEAVQSAIWRYNKTKQF
jgi:hypothetical protein